MSYELDIRRSEGATIASLTGRFGQEAAEALFDAVRDRVGAGGLVVDLSAVEYVGSSAIGCLVRLAVDHGPVVVRPSEFVRRALELAEVSMFVQTCTTIEEGLARVAEPGRGDA